MENIQAWHLDRRIPIALLLAVLVQSASIVWWGASINARVNEVEDKTDAQETSIAAIISAQATRGERIAALEAGQRLILETLRRIDTKLDQFK